MAPEPFVVGVENVLEDPINNVARGPLYGAVEEGDVVGRDLGGGWVGG